MADKKTRVKQSALIKTPVRRLPSKVLGTGLARKAADALKKQQKKTRNVTEKAFTGISDSDVKQGYTKLKNPKD